MTLKTDSIQPATRAVGSGAFKRDTSVHRLTSGETLLLLVGGGLLALAAAAGGNLLGVAACNMDDAAMQRVSARAATPHP